MSRPWGRDGDIAQPAPDEPAGPGPAPSAGEPRHYVVFNCQACGAKIFAEASQIGRAGVCPACKQMTGVAPRDPNARVAGPGSGRTRAARPSSPPVTGVIGSSQRAGDRRRSRRVPVNDAHVGVEASSGRGQAPVTSSGDLSELLDISEGGVGFVAHGVPDRKKLAGFSPPPIKIGEVVTITLHVPALFRPRTVKAVVRRIEPYSTSKSLFRVGAEFVGLAEDAKGDLKRMIERRA